MNLVDVLAARPVLLLDFDGPVCDVFAGYPATVIADELRDLAVAHGAQLTEDM